MTSHSRRVSIVAVVATLLWVSLLVGPGGTPVAAQHMAPQIRSQTIAFGRRWRTGLVRSSFVTVFPNSGTKSRGCTTASWPGSLRGEPDMLVDTDETGAFLWFDAEGWHLRVTHRGTSRVVFRGSVEASQELLAVNRSAQSNNEVRFTKDRTRVRFQFVNYGNIDGIDFYVGCSSGYLLKLSLDAKTMSPSQVFLGARAEHPPSMPVRIER